MTIVIDYQNNVDLVHSPDDGGYYLVQYSLTDTKTRVSKAVYTERIFAIKAYRDGAVEWEEWR